MNRTLIALLLLAIPGALYGQQPAPELSLSVNGKQSINLYSGWPLIVHVTIMNSTRLAGSGGAAPLVVAPSVGAWTDAIQFTVVSSSGPTMQWPLKLIGTPDSPSLTLAPTSYVRAFWQMAPADVTAIPADTYQVTATLQVANSNGWNGFVQSRPAAVQVEPEPTLPADVQSQKAILLSEYATNAGDLETALAGVQQLMRSQPSNTLAMSAAANLSELQGLPGLAYVQISNAANAYYATNPSLTEPPFNMLTILQRSLEAILAADAAEAPTSTSVTAPTVAFSSASQTVTLTASVSSPGSGLVNGGTVTLSVAGVGNPVTSSPISQGTASVSFTLPGSTPVGNYPIQATYSGTANFAASVDAADALTIAKATPVVNWSAPGSLPAGTALGASQLDATANVPGTFVYNPPAGTVPPSGTTQTLSVTFTPSDSTDYNSATASVSVMILGGSYSGSVSPTSATIPVGSSQNFTISVNSSTFDGPISLACANPPAGITCQFQPSQLSLSPNAASSTILTVQVTAKPAVVLLRPPAGPLDRVPSTRLIVMVLTVATFILVLYATVRDLRRYGCSHRSLLPGRLSLALLLFASLHMAACVSAGLTGQNPPKNGGGGSPAPASVTLTIQGTSGANTAQITTLSITVP